MLFHLLLLGPDQEKPEDDEYQYQRKHRERVETAGGAAGSLGKGRSYEHGQTISLNRAGL
jgi:hypothetical protein